MTKNGKCLWIVETLLQAGALSLREQLNERGSGRRSMTTAESKNAPFPATRSISRMNMPSRSTIHLRPTRMTLSIGKQFATMRSIAICSRPYHIADLNTQTLAASRPGVMMEPVPTVCGASGHHPRCHRPETDRAI